VIERFVGPIKDEQLHRILLPLRESKLGRELGLDASWSTYTSDGEKPP
jgi:hypothetical protein